MACTTRPVQCFANVSNPSRASDALLGALGDLVDVIKDEGDEAVHQNELYNKGSAEALQRFTETFLAVLLCQNF